jgi:hypothetical protein
VKLGPHEWPDLPEQAFVRGRAATESDVNAGHAAFVLQPQGGQRPQPLNIPIPQYAYHRDGGTGVRTPGIVIQAEQAAGTRIVGMRKLEGGDLMAGLVEEFEFLGTRRPIW